ncbi:MAG TPA: PEP/pyruvate-binding domain-containing protein [Xanthomonadales bacterium]|nr:PEP/pyruvate-binding domain-containing protein [Xanthomonadales bacterium]
MPVRAELAGVASPDFEVVGGGTIGEKAEQLRSKTPALKSIGFHVPPRTVLADGFLGDFMARNRIDTAKPPANLERAIRRGSLSQEQFVILQRTFGSHGSKPLIIRSSAEGDARGTGIYESEVTDNNIKRGRKILQGVWASYFSESAVAFRRDAGLSEGFGVILEPLVGQSFGHGEYFAPVMSGFGYTSTPREGANISVVPGIGGGVDSRYGEKLTRDRVAIYDYDLSEYIYEESSRMTNVGNSRKSALLGTAARGWRMHDAMLADVLWKGNEFHSPKMIQQLFDPGSDLNETVMSHDFQLSGFFDMIDQMEQTFGKPQYFEWAVTIEDGEPKYWILQIADVDAKADYAEFQEGTPLLSAHTVTGSGQKECAKIFNCWNPSDIENLRRFNQENTGYVLLYPSRLTTSWGTMFGGPRLKYADLSNASVIVEIQDANHEGDPISHFGGQVDMTGKFFGVLDDDPDNSHDWDTFIAGAVTEEGSEVYQGKVKVVASERRNKMAVYPLEE